MIISIAFFNGNAHDMTMYKTTTHVHSSILLVADSGFRGLEKVHENCQYPLRHKEDKARMPDDERRRYNRAVSSLRMKIEHVIGLIKRFKIVAERYRNKLKRFGLRFSLICGIVNYENR
jgi:hypothetical protein